MDPNTGLLGPVCLPEVQMPRVVSFSLSCILYALQWRRQDLLRGGAKLENRSWCTRGALQGRLQQLLDD